MTNYTDALSTMAAEPSEVFEQFHYETLLEDVPQNIQDNMMIAPMFIGADSEDLIWFLETEYRKPVSMDNYLLVMQLFRQWYARESPDEYHEPEAPSMMDFSYGGTRWGSGRIAGQGEFAGGRPLSGAAPRIQVSITLDPDVLRKVDNFAEQEGISRSEAINRSLANVG